MGHGVMSLTVAIVALFLLSAVAVPASAQQQPAELMIGVGAAGIQRHVSHVTQTEGLASLEYRSDTKVFRQVRWLAGTFVTTDGAFYAHLGIYRDWNFSPRWSLTPHISVGLYARGSHSDLGNALEFQTGLDLLRRLDNGWRVGATLRHISNAGTGEYNPGTETLALIVTVPLR